MVDGPREIPSSRLGRVARLVSLGARAGANKILSREGQTTHQVAEALGTLRGLAAKVGQVASYVDGVVPEGQSELWDSVLGKLRAAAPTTEPREIRRMIQEDLGAPVEELFATWEEQPFASASIGQVHRATLHDGTRVAVKVHHAGIAEAVESDLRNIAMLEGVVGPLGARKLDSKNVVAVLSARFREELDYRGEAERQRRFAALNAADVAVKVPAVVADRSSSRVLTTVFADGLTLAEAGKQPDEIRRRYAETIWRFVFRSAFVGRVFNVDPHPGNYIFQPDGSVVFLDFGCVQELHPSWHRSLVEMHAAALAKDDPAFLRALDFFLGSTKGGRFEKPMVDYNREVFAPLLRSPFHITKAYASGLYSEVQRLAKEISAVKQQGEYVPPPPESTMMSRQQFGMYSVLARLDVRADYASATDAVLPHELRLRAS